MNKKILSMALSLVMLLSAFSALPVTVADLEDDIEASIELGVGWLATCPWPGPDPPADGGWGGPGEWERTAMTALALIKLQDRAYELGYESPFDPAYEHSEIIIDGWDYIFSYGVPQAMALQDHTAGYSGTNDDPDTDGDGWGVYFHSQLGWHPTYTTGVVLMALEASGTPGRITAYDFDGVGGPDSFFDVAQDASDWLSFAQTDSGSGEGGWIYDAADNSGVQPDNSNGGYAVLGLAAAEGMGCTVPDWVKTELDSYIDYIQNDPGTSDDGGESDPDGGSGYVVPWDWVNVLKTGNLLFQMTFVGDDPSTTRFQYAMDYIIRHWQDIGGGIYDPGWGYSTDPAKYQAMYCLMKGFEYSGIDLIDLDGDDVPEHDWYAEFAQVIVDQQYGLGYWMDASWANDIVDTCWALLTLERVAPPPPVITVSIDIKPCSWPNPINKDKNGVTSIAICGTEDFDVMTIDPSTVMLHNETSEVGVPPLRWCYEDVATPYPANPDDPEGHEENGDGYVDLVLKYKTPEYVEKLNLCVIDDWEYIKLYLKGILIEEEGGTPIEGFDWVRIQSSKGKGKGKNK